MCELMREKKLFSPELNDNNKRIILGDTTNVFDLYNIKYDWAYDLWMEMLGNHWIPEKTPMLPDQQGYEKLTDEEKDAYDRMLSFLIYMDSLQTNNLPNITEYITASEIVLALTRQTFEEALHSRSYGHMLTSMYDKEHATKVIYYWKNDPILLKRNKAIADVYQKFKDEPSIINFIVVLFANFFLEGIYFYNGFNFFYNLSNRNLMQASAKQIRFINRDELRHTVLFRNIIKGVANEEPEKFEKALPIVKDLLLQVVEEEIMMSHHILGDKILGITKATTTEYTHYLANKRSKEVGLGEPWPDATNPYKHLEKQASIDDESTAKANNFESTSSAYQQATTVEGWEEARDTSRERKKLF